MENQNLLYTSRSGVNVYKPGGDRSHPKPFSRDRVGSIFEKKLKARGARISSQTAVGVELFGAIGACDPVRIRTHKNKLLCGAANNDIGISQRKPHHFPHHFPHHIPTYCNIVA